MKTRAAVLDKIGAPLTIRKLTVPDLQRGQVLVRLQAAGVCHSQLSEIAGERGADKYLPHLLGHEGAGVVEAVGVGVKKVHAGDTVILTWIQGKGLAAGGVQYEDASSVVNAGPIAVFSEYAVVSENRLIPVGAKIASQIEPKVLALFGCAVPTGVGAVVNTLKVRPKSTVAVFGVGGVGLCSVMAAKLAGASRVFAIDIVPAKLRLARKAGATTVINAAAKGAGRALQSLQDSGVQYAVAATGIPQVIEQAFDLITDGGKVAVVGHPPHGKKIRLDPHALIRGKQIIGSWGGDVHPDRDIARYLAWHIEGKLPVDLLVGKTYGLAWINQAMRDLSNGSVVRPIIVF